MGMDKVKPAALSEELARHFRQEMFEDGLHCECGTVLVYVGTGKTAGQVWAEHVCAALREQSAPPQGKP